MKLPRRLLGAVAVLLVAILLECVSYAAIVLTRPYLDTEIRTTRSIYRQQTEMLQRLLRADPDRRDQVDGELGWRYRPGFTVPGDRINAEGLRAEIEYTAVPADGVLRVAAFGDSFVYGTEVSVGDSWARRLELTDDPTAPALEVLNYGVGGYGTDQALLRYRAEGAALSPHIVLIGFMPIQLGRNVGRYRRFFDTRDSPWVKPRFVLGGSGSLTLIPTPIRSLDDWRPYIESPEAVRAFGTDDWWYEPLVYENPVYDLSATVRLFTHTYLRLRDRYFGDDRLVTGGIFRTESSAFRLTMALMREFAAEVRAAGAHPIFLFLPDEGPIRAVRSGGRAVYAPLADSLRSLGEEVLDAADAFVEPGAGPAEPGVDVDAWFRPEGHYAPEANRRVADWLRPRLLVSGAPRAGSVRNGLESVPSGGP